MHSNYLTGEGAKKDILKLRNVQQYQLLIIIDSTIL